MFVLLFICNHLYLNSFPTRRSSDLEVWDRSISSVITLFGYLGFRISKPIKSLTSSCRLNFFCSTSCMSRSEEHTSELQSRGHLVCRLLLEKKKMNIYN